MVTSLKNEKNKLTEVYITFLKEKNNIIKNNSEIYKWYIKLEKIYFSYLGINKSYCDNIEELMHIELNYSIKHVPKEFKEECTKLFREICYILKKIEDEMNILKKICSLSQYEKNILFKKELFDIDIKNNFEDITLISIKVEKSSPKIYMISISNDNYNFKQQCRKDNKIIELFYKEVEGEYKKDEIKFNINKKYIQEITINDKGTIKKLSVDEFEKEYGSLRDFFIKELENLTYKTNDKLVSESIDDISNFLGVRFMPLVTYEKSLKGTTVGEYSFRRIRILSNPTFKKKKEILIHEYAHFIHDVYFGNKQFRFSTKEKSRYAKKNYRENFAECFTDLIYNRKNNERTKKMLKILEEIV